MASPAVLDCLDRVAPAPFSPRGQAERTADLIYASASATVPAGSHVEAAFRQHAALACRPRRTRPGGSTDNAWVEATKQQYREGKIGDVNEGRNERACTGGTFAALASRNLTTVLLGILKSKR
jgi:hypothetical protein